MQISVQTRVPKRVAQRVARALTLPLLALGTVSATLLAGCGSSGGVDVNAVPDIAAAPSPKPEPPPAQIDVPFTQVNAPLSGEAKALSAKGGSFPSALYKAWFAKYGQQIGVQVTYEGVGSSEAIKRLINRDVDFAASDAPMSVEEQQSADAKGKDLLASGTRDTMSGTVLHIPTAFGAIAIAYNVPEISGPLKFTPKTIGDIYNGEIKRWNDPELVRDNPQLISVKREIIAIHRSDGSGTTYGFTDYLVRVSPAWTHRSGKGESVFWNQGIGAAKSDGVATILRQNPYAIGYLELGYAQRNKLTYGLVQNSAGRFVEPSLASIEAAAKAVSQNPPADLRFTSVNAPGPDSYPLVTATWLLVYRNIPNRAKATAITRLLQWATTDAQSANASLNYAPVPAELRAKSATLIRQITSGG